MHRKPASAAAHSSVSIMWRKWRGWRARSQATKATWETYVVENIGNSGFIENSWWLMRCRTARAAISLVNTATLLGFLIQCAAQVCASKTRARSVAWGSFWSCHAQVTLGTCHLEKFISEFMQNSYAMLCMTMLKKLGFKRSPAPFNLQTHSGWDYVGLQCMETGGISM